MSDSEEDWDEDGEGVASEDQPTPCLFCSEVQLSGEATLAHCRVDHAINLSEIGNKLKLDYYGWIKLINYIRKQRPTVADVRGLVSAELFDGEEYLVPVLTDDWLLQIDWEEMTSGGISDEESSLREKLLATEQQLSLSRTALDAAMKDIASMREAMQQLTLSADDKETAVLKDEEDSYFTGYSHHGIHEEMLKDEVRMDSYQLFISRNPEIFKDKVVLDVGCGTGILSFFAVQAGASHVIAIDQSAIIYKAKEIARENGLDGRITFIRGEVESVTLPVEKVDVIISEWMGYFLLFESMLDTVLFARDKWLRNPKNVYPNRCNMSLVAIGDGYEYNSKISFWDNVRGFKMSCLKEDILNEPCIKLIDEYSIISTSDVIKKFDLSKVKPADLEFETTFKLTVKQNDTCHALVGYFDVSFEVPSYRVYFSTSPQDTPTHWYQTVFFLKEPIKVTTGDLLHGTIGCCKNKSCPRSLDVKIVMKLAPLSEQSVTHLLIDHTYCLS